MLKKKGQTIGMVSKYRAKLYSIIKPSVYLAVGSGILVFVALFIKEDFQIALKMVYAASILSAVLLIFNLFLIGICTYFYKITIYNDGLSSYNPWESFKCYHMKWADMKYLTIRIVLGYKYYHITSLDQQKSLWVPFNIKSKKQFIEDLNQLINDDHVLMQHIGKA